MQHLQKKVAYIHGLAEGSELHQSKEGRILEQIIYVLKDMAEVIDQFEVRHQELETYVESIDEDLQDIEEDVYEDIEQEDYVGDAGYIEVECPGCRDIVCFETEILDDEDKIEVICPNCDEVVYVNDGSYETEIRQRHKYSPARKNTNEDI